MRNNSRSASRQPGCAEVQCIRGYISNSHSAKIEREFPGQIREEEKPRTELTVVTEELDVLMMSVDVAPLSPGSAAPRDRTPSSQREQWFSPVTLLAESGGLRSLVAVNNDSNSISSGSFPGISGAELENAESVGIQDRRPARIYFPINFKPTRGASGSMFPAQDPIFYVSRE